MKIVIDTNVIMAGLLKDSFVRKILMSKNIEFFIPKYALQEITKYSKYLIKKSRSNKEDFTFVLNSLLENIKIVPKNLINPHMDKADLIMKKIDLNDSVFIATCFGIGADGIWSFDKHFKKQKEIKVFDIEEVNTNV